MRTLALGDVHGCYNALTTLMQFIPLRDKDLLIALGDYVDRGPNSAAVVEWMLRREKTGRLIPLLGNHELMMIQARDSSYYHKQWVSHGGNHTLDSYLGDINDVPHQHWQFLEHRCRRYHETSTHIFVHAKLHPDYDLQDQPDFILLWEKFKQPLPHKSGKVMVCGHTPQKGGRPNDIGHAICIDTWAYGLGWLTCMDVETGVYWQANEAGETRHSKTGTQCD